jgi:hypothetical protein
MRPPVLVEHVDAPAVMASEVSMSRTGMPAQEESGEEHHGDDENHTGDDPDPRHHLIQPARLVAGGWRWLVSGQRRRGRIVGCLVHDSDDAQVAG